MLIYEDHVQAAQYSTGANYPSIPEAEALLANSKDAVHDDCLFI